MLFQLADIQAFAMEAAQLPGNIIFQGKRLQLMLHLPLGFGFQVAAEVSIQYCVNTFLKFRINPCGIVISKVLVRYGRQLIPLAATSFATYCFDR